MPGFEAIDYRSDSASGDFCQSLRETGFGVLSNHPLDQSLITKIYDHWLTFFSENLSGEYPRDFAMQVATQDGFFSREIAESAKGESEQDIKEYFHFYPWGRCPSSLRQELQAYFESASTLASELLDWIQQHTPDDISRGYSESLSDMIVDSRETLLRVLHYPHLTGDEPTGALRAAAHEDINLITILPSSNQAGLQVKGSDGRWIDVPEGDDKLVVNIGDMLQEVSGGYYPSTTHRVINPTFAANKPRMSLPLFLHPRPDVRLSERYTAASYLEERLRELGVK